VKDGQKQKEAESQGGNQHIFVKADKEQLRIRDDAPANMAVKLIACYSKRMGLPGYSNHQFSVCIETDRTELPLLQSLGQSLPGRHPAGCLPTLLSQ